MRCTSNSDADQAMATRLQRGQQLDQADQLAADQVEFVCRPRRARQLVHVGSAQGRLAAYFLQGDQRVRGSSPLLQLLCL